jgi:16S rRNA processing protein RimM
LSVGRIGRPHGISGEVAIDPETDIPEQRFAVGTTVMVGRSGEALRAATIVTCRPHTSRLLVRFDIATGRDAAQDLTGGYVFIPTADARELEPDEYYEHDLIGLAVETVSGEPVGVVTRLIETGAADVLVIKAPEREHLIPMTGEVVADVDLGARRMRIHPLPGLLD